MNHKLKSSGKYVLPPNWVEQGALYSGTSFIPLKIWRY